MFECGQSLYLKQQNTWSGWKSNLLKVKSCGWFLPRMSYFCVHETCPAFAWVYKRGWGQQWRASMALWQVVPTQVQEQQQLLTRDPILHACKHSLHHSVLRARLLQKQWEGRAAKLPCFQGWLWCNPLVKESSRKKRWNFQCWRLWHLEVTFSRDFSAKAE